MAEPLEAAASLRDSKREQIKLTATYFNGIAVGLVLVGGLSLPTTIVLNAVDPFASAAAVALGLFSFASSAYLHARAKWILKGLDA